MSILCVGQVAYDITFPIDGELIENQKYRIYEKMECMGGPAGNASFLCALWGSKVSLMARIGKDIYGEKILDILNKVGTDTSCLIEDEAISTSISGIVANRKNGYRTVFNCPILLKESKFKYPLMNPNMILVDGHELQASIDVLEYYPSAISVLDGGTCNEITIELAKRVNYLICSEDFAYQYCGIKVCLEEKHQWINTFNKLHQLNQQHIAVTLGDQGLLYEDDEGIHHLPAYPVKAIDTCGAGDIFHGAFAYCINKDYSFKDALKISSITAAISVESYGGQVSIPTKEVVNERLKEAKETISLK
ncbi:MAG: PfkB family carbohydrate kinase [Erysipelotrichaceae bacterium]